MRIMGRTIFIALGMLVMAAAAASASARAATSVQYRVEGRGWGHGIGLSQYGAQGYAEQGWSHERIISHFYKGTVVAPRPVDGPTSMRVLLQSHLAPARIEMTSAGTVRQGAATMNLAPRDIVAMQAVAGNIVVTRTRPGEGATSLTGGGSAQPTIIPNVDGGMRIMFTPDYGRRGNAYRGTLHGVVFEGRVSIVNTVPFENYLRGVVPDEMPPSWHPQALRAQAIAARSYALRSIGSRYDWFDVYSTTSSQVYGGIGAEEESSDAAVAETEGMVARVGGPEGEVAHAFFFSTSAGRTAGNNEVWNSSPYSYLRSVASPHEAKSPYFFWRGSDIGRYTPAALGAKMGIGALTSATVRVHPSGYVREVVARTRGGGVQRLSGSTVQARMGLRSTYFRLQRMSVSAPASVAPGELVTLTGDVPASGKTTLILKRSGGVKVVTLKRNAAGKRWRVRMRMPAAGGVLATMSRSGIAGPRVFVRPG